MLYINNDIVEIKHFPDKTLLMKVAPVEDTTFTWRFENNEEFLALQMLVMHFRTHGIKNLKLHMPYIPNARQDRLKKETDIFTLKYFATLLNNLEFSEVVVLDAHSNVSLELINNIKEMPVKPYIEKVMEELQLNPNRDYIFYPDKGARLRYSDMLDFPNLYGEKVRDFETGQIKGLDIIGETPIKGFRAFIIDDISSYGGTFYHCAKKLKEIGASEIYLYVSHAENSILDGELMKSNLITKIYTTESIFTKQHEIINIVKLEKENL